MMDEHRQRATEARIEAWGEEIERRAAEPPPPDQKVDFADLQHIDELKVLLATARAMFVALTAAAAAERSDLEREFTVAWNEFEAAVDKPPPP